MSDERRSDPELEAQRGYNGPVWLVELVHPRQK